MSFSNSHGRQGLPRRNVLLLSALLASASLAVTGQAARAQQATEVEVNLPAGNMSTVLNRLAAQSGLQLVFDAELTRGLKARAVSGRMAPQQALDAVLAGTGIRYRFIGQRTVKLETVNPAGDTSDAGATQLDTITVLGAGAFSSPGANTARLDTAQIEKAQASSIAELLRHIPGLDAGGGVRLEGQTIAIRGFARQSDVRIVLDGAPKNFEKYDQGTLFVEPELLKSVEVMKGATSVRNGNGGFGGTIVMERRTAGDMLRPGEDWGVFAKTAYHSANKQFIETGAIYGKSDFGGPVTFDALGSFTWRKSDDMRIGGGEVYLHSDTKLKTFSGNVGAAWDGHEVRLSGSYGKNDNWGPVAAIRGQLDISAYSINRYGYELARLRTLTKRDIDDYSATLRYNYDGDSDLVNLKALASYSYTGQHAIRPEIAGFNASASVGGHENEASYADILLELENTSNFDLGGFSHTANYGVQYNRHKRDVWMFDRANANSAQYNYGRYAPWFMPEGTQETFSLFFRDEIALSDTLKITPGLRFDHVRSEGVPNAAPRYNNPAAGHDYSAVSHNGVTPALSISWEAGPQTTLYANWAYAMRAPNIDELYSTQSVVSSASATSRGLKIERNNNFNIGIRQGFDDVFTDRDELTVTLELFYNHVSNSVWRRFGSANLAGASNVPWYWNIRPRQIFGVEALAHYENDRIFADLGVSWMNGTQNGAVNDLWGPSTWAKDLSPLTVNTLIGFKVPDHNLAFGYRGLFVDGQEQTPRYQGSGIYYARPVSAGYAVHDIFLDWTPDSGVFKDTVVHAALENIFDKKYMPYLTDGISAMPGRNFKISVSRKF